MKRTLTLLIPVFSISRVCLLVLLWGALPIRAHAGLLAHLVFEPYAGYQFPASLNVKVETDSPVNEGIYKGLGLGLRTVYRFGHLFFVGSDVSYAPSLDYATAPETELNSFFNQSAQNLRLGVVAGFSIPGLPLRFFGGFNPLDMVLTHSTSSGISADIQLIGTSFKGGIGFKPLPFIIFNAEYIVSTYGILRVSGDTPTVTTANTTFGQKVVFLSASIPIQF